MIDRRKKYEQMREVKRISFHLEREAHLLKRLDGIKADGVDISTYVKKLIREDMKKWKQQHTNT